MNILRSISISKFPAWLPAIVAILIVIQSPLSASPEKGSRKMVVIAADRAGSELFQGDLYPGIKRMIDSGAAGLMVTKTLKTGSKSAAHTTLGSGLRADHSDIADLSFNAAEMYMESKASDIYWTRTGVAPKTGNVLNTTIGRIININLETDWVARPGALGSLLEEGGLSTAVIGNSDYDEIFSRNAVLIAMNEKGKVDGGDVSRDILTPDPAAPWGLKTEPGKTLRAFKEYYARHDFIVIEYGDITRAEVFADLALLGPASRARAKSLRRLDRLVSLILDNVDLKTTQVILISPTPPKLGISNKDTLTPIVIAGAGVKKGILLTDATKRRGLALNTDFAPHVADYFRLVPPPDFIGSKMFSEPMENVAPALVAMAARDSFVELQSGVLQGVVVWHIIALAICFLAAIKLSVLSSKWRTLLTGMILYTTTLFLSFLIIAGLPVGNNLVLFYATGAAVGAVIALAASVFKGAEARALFLSIVYAACICADQLTGANLIKNSVLGYYPQIGARFYGIGNEYMGFIVSAPILIIGILLDLKKEWESKLKLVAFPLFAFCVFIVGSPTVGANFGGLISCATSAFFMLVYLYKGSVKGRTIILSAVVVGSVVVASVLFDAIVLGGKTHVGQLFGRILSGGGAGKLLLVISRKLATNVRLLRFSIWSALFVASIVMGSIVHYIPLDTLKRLFSKCEGFRKAYLASLFGALAAFVFNDSGIVPGATSLVLPSACLFMLIFSREHIATFKSSDFPKAGD